MVARGPGAVGCAHCRLIGAGTSCQVCERLVCPACAADWSTCGAPSGRLVRLGATARLHDVDPGGRLGLVSRWWGAMRLLDLGRLRWIAHPRLPRQAMARALGVPPRLTSDGRLVQVSIVNNNDVMGFSATFGSPTSAEAYRGITTRSLNTGATREHELPVPTSAGTGVSAIGDRYWYVSDTQLVIVLAPLEDSAGPLPASTDAVSLAAAPDVDLPLTETWSLEPLPKKVVQAAYVDGERDLLAAGTWGEVVLHRIAAGRRLQRLASATTTGDLRWIAVHGPWLAAAVARGTGTELVVWRLGEDLAIRDVAYRHERAGFEGASLSRDGRYLAMAFDGELVVQALGTGEISTFREHTDRIGLVRFVGSDHRLITGDHDARIVLRPRTPAGYASPLVPIDVPDEPVELPVPTSGG